MDIVVTSENFWLGSAGISDNLVGLGKKIFKREVLGRRRSLQIFETDSMKTLIHHLNLHGFSKMEGNSPTCASQEKLQALAAAGSAFGKSGNSGN
ncbi:PREDICTED: heat shock transcription factor, Y-linked-like [Tauraco erythrolophus]|uniref:heat shock transcription factor, Y-linked-like n=1 Tax=Tauraco erythrolophus TaxID=121530 RepID=UPI000523178D|nr:PREDICTED: heat shock transcription factor, Y-linked-like [Tauraco erythrolophus]